MMLVELGHAVEDGAFHSVPRLLALRGAQK
jgi:hypothetical protein